MTKKSARVQAIGAPTEPPPLEVPTLQVPLEVKPVFSFPNKSRCPRCGSLDTKAYGTDGDLQYRMCEAAICRWKYKVRGAAV